MKKSIRIIAALAVLVLMFVFTGCVSERPSDEDNKGLPSIDNPWWTDSGEITKDGDGNIEFDDVSIKLTSVICGYDQNGFEALLDQFNKLYKGKINVTHQTYSQDVIDEYVMQQIQNETNAPDLILTHQKTHAYLAANKIIQPMDAAYELAGLEADKSNFLPNFADYCDLGYEGRMFTIPVDAQSMVMYYNKNLLKKYGEELPQTRAEFLELCRKVQSGERATNAQFNAVTCGADYDFFKMYLLPTAVLQNGGELYGSDGLVHWTEGSNFTAFKNGIQAVKQLADDGLWDSSDSNESARAKFCKDNALFYISLPFDANTVFSAYASNSGHSPEVVKSQDIGGFSTAGMFALDGAPEASKNKIFGDSHAFAMSKTVSNVTKKAAIAVFVNWFTTNVDVGIEWAKLGHTTASYTIRGNAAYNADSYVSEFCNMFYGDINNFVTAGKTANYTLIFPDMQTALLNCLRNASNEYDIKTELQNAQKKINAAIGLA